MRMPRSRSNAGVWISLTLAGIVAACTLVWATTPLSQAYSHTRDHQEICVLLAGVLGLLHWLLAMRGARAAPTGWKWEWLGLCLPAYALFQLVPLPLGVLRLVSPARARLVDTLVPLFPKPGWAPLSVTPSATVYYSLLLAMCGIVFLVIYDIGGRLAAHPWAVAVPLIVLAAAEAALGLLQASDPKPEIVATGTFAIRNHYAGFLEMVLPFAVIYGLAVLSRQLRGGRGHITSMTSVLAACVGFVAAGLMLMGILASQSRMGFLSTAGSCAFIGVAALRRGRSWRRMRPALAAGIVIAVLAVFLLPSSRFILRFSDTEQDRPEVWRETLPLIATYPLFGCGLGGYESAFYPFKASNPTKYQEYAHNDYLQYLAEMGVVGFLIAAVPLAAVLYRLPGRWSQRLGPDDGWVSLACAGSAVAIGLHSIADFNLYIPANMLVFAWVLGITAASPRDEGNKGHPPREAYSSRVSDT